MKATRLSKSKYRGFLTSLIKNKASFSVVHKGDTIEVDMGRSYQFADFKKQTDTGFWLPRFVYQDIDKQEIKPLDKIADSFEQLPKGRHSNRVFFNSHFVENLLLNSTDDVVNMDMKHCYWRVAMLLGYISEDTYKKGLQPNVSKMARLMSIGVLNARKTKVIYNKGVKIASEDITDTNRRQAYENILTYVENLFLSVNMSSKSNYENNYFFLTDEFFIAPEFTSSLGSELKNRDLLFRTERGVYAQDEGKVLINYSNRQRKIIKPYNVVYYN